MSQCTTGFYSKNTIGRYALSWHACVSQATQHSGKSGAPVALDACGRSGDAGVDATPAGQPDLERHWWKDAMLTFGAPGDPEALERLMLRQEQQVPAPLTRFLAPVCAKQPSSSKPRSSRNSSVRSVQRWNV